MYNCPKCGAPAAGCDTSCDCWSPWTGWKDGLPPKDESGKISDRKFAELPVKSRIQ
jgi:hypothetical protein